MNETRFNIFLRGQSADLVNALADQGYRPKDVIYDALSILDFAIHEIAAQRQFGSFDAESRTMNTVVTPILREAAKNPEWLRAYLGQYADQPSQTADSL